MNEIFKDILCYIVCFYLRDKWELEKNCWGENMVYIFLMNWYFIYREVVKLYYFM